MGKMGRPRHPDILTPREWEVLALLRERLTNEEVAQRLGISLDGAKYHVSQILSKLGVATREQAATLAVGERRRWWAAWPLWAKIAAGATAGTAIAGGTAIGWGVLANNDSLYEEELPPTSPTPSVRHVPAIGDHWHAAYAVFIGDEEQAAIPEFITTQGIHTHGDGIVHVHPFLPEGEGDGSSLSIFFELAGGTLTDTSLLLPGSETTFIEGDPLPGRDAPGSIRILRTASGHESPVVEFANFIASCGSLADSDFEEVGSGYVPKDGDCIRIRIAPN
jgi:DNA-binding CsgD family transcriptional regulator